MRIYWLTKLNWQSGIQLADLIRNKPRNGCIIEADATRNQSGGSPCLVLWKYEALLISEFEF